MCDLERIYIFVEKKYDKILSCSIKIIGENEINYKSILITSFCPEDLDKMGQLIEYFLYSDDFESFEMYSEDYGFLLEDLSQYYEKRLFIV